MPYVSHEKLIEDNKPDYYLVLRRSQKTFKTNQATIISWLEFFLEIVFKQVKLATVLLSAENVEKLLSPAQLKTWKYLQQAAEATPKELSEKFNIPRPTVNQILSKLIKLKKIERLGQGRSTRYRKFQGLSKETCC